MNLETANKLHHILNSLLDKGEITLEGADQLGIVIDASCGIKGWIEAAETDEQKSKKNMDNIYALFPGLAQFAPK